MTHCEWGAGRPWRAWGGEGVIRRVGPLVAIGVMVMMSWHCAALADAGARHRVVRACGTDAREAAWLKRVVPKWRSRSGCGVGAERAHIGLRHAQWPLARCKVWRDASAASRHAGGRVAAPTRLIPDRARRTHDDGRCNGAPQRRVVLPRLRRHGPVARVEAGEVLRAERGRGCYPSTILSAAPVRDFGVRGRLGLARSP